jgi:hypothetical protein
MASINSRPRGSMSTPNPLRALLTSPKLQRQPALPHSPSACPLGRARTLPKRAKPCRSAPHHRPAQNEPTSRRNCRTNPTHAADQRASAATKRYSLLHLFNSLRALRASAVPPSPSPAKARQTLPTRAGAIRTHLPTFSVSPCLRVTPCNAPQPSPPCARAKRTQNPYATPSFSTPQTVRFHTPFRLQYSASRTPRWSRFSGGETGQIRLATFARHGRRDHDRETSIQYV